MANYEKMIAGLHELIDNPAPRVPVGLCLDVSGSMAGQPIQELNNGVQQYLKEIREDERTLDSAETAVVTFSDQVTCAADFNTADRLKVPTFMANGRTHLGEGLELTLKLLEERKRKYQIAGTDYYQPMLIVMTDGKPNGDPMVLNRALERTQKMVAARKLTVIPIGIGMHADMEMLKKLGATMDPIRLSSAKLMEFFSWLSQSVSAVSNSTPGDEPELDALGLAKLAAQPWPDQLR